MDEEVKNIIEKIGLVELINGHYIKEDYCSESLLWKDLPLFNWAYYLIQEGQIFPLHKLLSEESWQICLGGPVDLFLLNEGEIETVRIGKDLFQDERLLYIVKKETWFAVKPAHGTKYSLITHCVSPGWTPERDIPGYYDEMIKLLPSNPEFVREYSWPENLSRI